MKQLKPVSIVGDRNLKHYIHVSYNFREMYNLLVTFIYIEVKIWITYIKEFRIKYEMFYKRSTTMNDQVIQPIHLHLKQVHVRFVRQAISKSTFPNIFLSVKECVSIKSSRNGFKN